MSSYFPSFSYTAPNGQRYNSFLDKNLIVVHFESGDSGEMDTFLGMDPIYTDNAYGTRRLDYGAKYNNVATIRISVMKADGKDFTVPEVRDFLRWTTGSRKATYLDLSDIVQGDLSHVHGDNCYSLICPKEEHRHDQSCYYNGILICEKNEHSHSDSCYNLICTEHDTKEIIRVSFLGRVTAVYQQKLDARTVGFVIEHTSVSPYAYSPVQYITCPFTQSLAVDEDGVLLSNEHTLLVDDNGVLGDGSSAFNVTNDGTAYVDRSVGITITNDTDDLSDYVHLDTTFTSTTSDHLVIQNQTLYTESDETDGITEITDIRNNEVITLHSGQFITSSANRTFGNNFNFIWPKLLPGDNDFIISGSGIGVVEFTYRYPIKIGDCSMNIDVSGSELCCNGGYNDDSMSGSITGAVTWNDILSKPDTISGYGITDAYTTFEVDSKIKNVTIDEGELNAMLEEELE